jgi:hypothetical protein
MQQRATKVGPLPSQVSEALSFDQIPTDSACYLFANALAAGRQ